MAKKPKDLNIDEMLNSINFNYNRLCALDLKVAGKDIIELCLYPMNSKFELAKSILPYYCLIQPIKSPIHMGKSEFRELGTTEEKYYEAYNRGMTKSIAFDIFEQWCEKKINMLEGRKIMPLTYDWGFKRHHLLNWLGEKNFNHFFHFHIRDILPMGLFANDFTNIKYERCPYPKVDFPYLCSQTRTEYSRHDTLLNCAAIAKIYHLMLHSWYSGHVKCF